MEYFRIQSENFNLNHKSCNRFYDYNEAWEKTLDWGYFQSTCKELDIKCVPENTHLVRNYLQNNNPDANKYIFIESGVSCFKNIEALNEYFKETGFWAGNMLFTIEGEFLGYGEDGECIIKPLKILSQKKLTEAVI